MVCVWILYIPNCTYQTTALLLEIFLFYLGRRMGRRTDELMAMRWSQVMQGVSSQTFVWLLFTYSMCACTVRPHADYSTTFAIELLSINSRNLVEEGAANSASSAQMVLLPALGVLASIIMTMIIVSSICCHAGLQYWWILMPTGLHCQDLIVTCGRPWMAGSVAEALSHEESSGGRNVTGVHRNAMGNNKSITGGMEMQRVVTEV